jgi:hypothetical protein
VTIQSQALRLADDLVSNPHLWPGGYPRYAITNDAAALCHECCRDERNQIATTTGSDGWTVVSIGVNWEDVALHCDNCGTAIPAAYSSVQA